MDQNLRLMILEDEFVFRNTPRASISRSLIWPQIKARLSEVDLSSTNINVEMAFKPLILQEQERFMSILVRSAVSNSILPRADECGIVENEKLLYDNMQNAMNEVIEEAILNLSQRGYVDVDDETQMAEIQKSIQDATSKAWNMVKDSCTKKMISPEEEQDIANQTNANLGAGLGASPGLGASAGAGPGASAGTALTSTTT